MNVFYITQNLNPFYLFQSEVQINKLLWIMRKNNLIQVIEKTKQTNKQEIDIGLEMQWGKSHEWNNHI